MGRLLEQIINIENLYWAWEKAKFFYKLGDAWINELEVSKFESNLHSEILNIKKQLLNNSYAFGPIRPIGFPKSQDDNGPRIRQSFWIPVRDQVTWLAVVNIIGPYFDDQMPFWSYGNRLYSSVFFDEDQKSGKKYLKFGYYRNTSKYTYRKWTHSWPLYRKHIAITAKIMANREKFLDDIEKFISEELTDEKEIEVLENNDLLIRRLRVQYLENTFWKRKLSGKIYWAGLDLKKFYPKVNLEITKKNFVKYYKSFGFSEELSHIIEPLFQFNINYKGWSKNELSHIDLESKPKRLIGIPTGLFVSGFIANVFMLDVDNSIFRKLKDVNNIAHFRFVDDHTILADSFEALTDWIQYYKNRIDKLAEGTEINYDKTEPEQLKYFLKNDFDACAVESDQDQISLTAKKACELDNQFLTPLMTKTLGKVSIIANTNFDILDNDEENQLISDIEHLLLADFPDQELRRDTRISFAASMLSRIVPLKQPNVDELYAAEKNTFQLNIEKKQIIDKQIKFQNDTERIDEITKEVKKLAIISRQCKKDIKAEEKKLRYRTLNLLLKAIRENHEKVRLWVRTIEFCFRIGDGSLERIVDVLDSLLKKNIINELSYQFLLSLILQTISNLIFRSYRILTTQDSTNLIIGRIVKFLNGILNLNFINRIFSNTLIDKFYCLESKKLFNFSIGSALYLFEHDNRARYFHRRSLFLYHKIKERFHIINWDSDLKGFLENTRYPLSVWAWWLNNRISEKMESNSTLLWPIIMEKLKFNLNNDYSFASLYPINATNSYIKILNKGGKANKYLKEEGWLFDMLSNLNEAKKYYINHPKIIKIHNIIHNNKEVITIDKWANWCKEQKDQTLKTKTTVFDPRLSEWTCLEVCIQIAEIINSKIKYIRIKSLSDLTKLKNLKKNQYYKIHPNNYKIPIEWKNIRSVPTWEEWKEQTQRNRIDNVALHNFIQDNRYTPRFENSDNQQMIEHSLVHGLGVILIGLLSSDFNFPPYWNPIGLQKAWLSLAYNRFIKIPISSRTNSILRSCFSKRNVETILIKVFQSELFKARNQPDDDTKFDPPEIFTVQDFIDYAKNSQKVLTKYQLTVQEHNPRQLIPVSLIQLSKTYDPFEETDNG